MEADLTVSYEKLAIDNEILGMTQRVLRGIEVDEDSLAKDLLIRKGPARDFLCEEHTVRHMRDEFYMPELANRQKREEFEDGEDTLTRAKRVVKRVRKVRPFGLLEEDLNDHLLQEFPEIRLCEPPLTSDKPQPDDAHLKK
jgi:trimethylamine--corrinoid protein Co-methyltransferase